MASSLLGLAPGGGYLAICITANAGGLLHHLFTITFVTLCRVRGCLFLWPSSGRLTPHGGVPRPGCYPTPCSMECGLSSIPTTQNRDRPTDLRQGHDTRKRDQRQPSQIRIWFWVYGRNSHTVKRPSPVRDVGYEPKSSRGCLTGWIKSLNNHRDLR